MAQPAGPAIVSPHGNGAAPPADGMQPDGGPSDFDSDDPDFAALSGLEPEWTLNRLRTMSRKVKRHKAARRAAAVVLSDVGIVPTVLAGDLFTAENRRDVSSDVAAMASLLGLPPPLAQLADPFSDDTVRIYTSIAAARDAAGLPAPRSKRGWLFGWPPAGSPRCIDVLALEARSILAYRGDVLRAEAAVQHRQQEAAARQRQQEAGGGGNGRKRRWWRPWRRPTAKALTPANSAAPTSSGSGGSSSPQWHPPQGAETAEPPQRWRSFSELPPPGLPRTQSFNMGTGLSLLAAHPGHALLVPHEQEVRHAEELRSAAAGDAELEPFRGVPVFAVPGVYLTLPSPRGNVRFTPLFLSRRLLDDTVAAAQDLATKSVRVQRRVNRRIFRLSVEHAAAMLTGLHGHTPGGGRHSSQGDDEPPEVDEFLKELNEGSRRGGGGSGGGGGVAEAISKAAVGVLSVMLRAYETVDNGIDSAIWATNLDVRLAGGRKRFVVMPHTLQEYVADCGRWNNQRTAQPGEQGAPAATPWSNEDLDSLKAGVTETVKVALKTVIMLHRQGVFGNVDENSFNFSVSDLGSNSAVDDLAGLQEYAVPNIASMQLNMVKATGVSPPGDPDAMDSPDVPNRGIILIGESTPEGLGSSTLQLGGRSVVMPTIGLANGGILATV